MRLNKSTFVLLAGSAVLMSGCGGGDGGGTGLNGNMSGMGVNGGNGNFANGTSGSGAGTSSVRLFATDSLTTGYDHVWVSIRQVALVGAGGNVTLFSDGDGKVVDLKTLRDESGHRFALMAAKSIPGGVYNGLKIELGNRVSLAPAKSETVETATFDGAPKGNKALSLSFEAPMTLKGDSDLIVDFKLADWTVSKGTVTAAKDGFIGVVNDSTLTDLARHEPSQYEGTASNLQGTGPAFTFQMNDHGAIIPVQMSSATTIVNATTVNFASLAKRASLQVLGVFSTKSNALMASSVIVEDRPAAPELIRGEAVAFDGKSSTLKVVPSEARGVLPGAGGVAVVIGPNTKIYAATGAALTSASAFGDLSKKTPISIDGTFNKGIFTAKNVRLIMPSALVAAVDKANPAGAGKTDTK